MSGEIHLSACTFCCFEQAPEIQPLKVNLLSCGDYTSCSFAEH